MQFGGMHGHDGYIDPYQEEYEEGRRKCYVPETGYPPINGSNDAMFINPKQIYWIKKRKVRREMLDSMMVMQKSNYLHESRHRHAMKRLRAPTGRFLTKEEAAALREQESSL